MQQVNHLRTASTSGGFKLVRSNFQELEGFGANTANIFPSEEQGEEETPSSISIW